MIVKTNASRRTQASDAVLATLLGDEVHRQERSRRNAAAIVRAMRELLKTQSFEDVTIADIARRAGTSVGGFYARFPSKVAVLEVILGAVTVEANAALDALQERVRGQDAATLLREWATVMVGVFRGSKREIRELMRNLPDGRKEDGPLGRKLKHLRDRARGFLRSELRSRAAELDADDLDVAISLALMVGTVTIREAVIGSALPGYGTDIDDERLAHEVSRCMAAYLGVAGA